MILPRRGLLRGTIGLLAMPAIVKADALMRISVPRIKPLFSLLPGLLNYVPPESGSVLLLALTNYAGGVTDTVSSYREVDAYLATLDAYLATLNNSGLNPPLTGVGALS